MINKEEENKELKRLVIKMIKGEDLTLNELSTLFGIKKNTIHRRLKRGWDIADAISKPPLSNSESGKIGKDRSKWK